MKDIGWKIQLFPLLYIQRRRGIFHIKLSGPTSVLLSEGLKVIFQYLSFYE